jgi:hypothetical protein
MAIADIIKCFFYFIFYTDMVKVPWTDDNLVCKFIKVLCLSSLLIIPTSVTILMVLSFVMSLVIYLAFVHVIVIWIFSIYLSLLATRKCSECFFTYSEYEKAFEVLEMVSFISLFISFALLSVAIVSRVMSLKIPHFNKSPKFFLIVALTSIIFNEPLLMKFEVVNLGWTEKMEHPIVVREIAISIFRCLVFILLRTDVNRELEDMFLDEVIGENFHE